MKRLDQWGKGIGIALRIYGAGLIAAIALSPIHFIPDDIGWPIKLVGLAYIVVVAPYAFYRGLGICGLAVRILNQGPTNSATRRKNEKLRREGSNKEQRLKESR